MKELNVTWTKDGQVLDLKEDMRMSVDENNTLTVSNATEDDVGEYACRVKTPVDEVVVVASVYKTVS